MTDAPESLPWFTLELPAGIKFISVGDLLERTAPAVHPHEPSEEDDCFANPPSKNPPGRIPIEIPESSGVAIRPFKRSATQLRHERKLAEAIAQGTVTPLNPLDYFPITPSPPTLDSDLLIPLEEVIAFAQMLRIQVQLVAVEPVVDSAVPATKQLSIQRRREDKLERYIDEVGLDRDQPLPITQEALLADLNRWEEFHDEKLFSIELETLKDFWVKQKKYKLKAGRPPIE